MKRFTIDLIAFLSIAAAVFFMRACSERKTNRIIEEAIIANNHLTSENITYKDKYNKIHVVAKQLLVDKLILEQEKAELAALLKIKPKQIKGEIEYVSTGEIIVQIHDTIYQDAWVKIEKGKNDTIKMNLTDTVTLVNYWKRKWFLAPKKYYTDVSNKSPYIHISKVYSIGVKPKTPTFILGPSIQYGFIPNQANIGISLLYYPISIKF